MKTFVLINCIFIFLFLFFPSLSSATPEFARVTGLNCGECHIDPNGGGGLTEKGKKYLYKPLTTAQKIVRLFVGYFHMMAAIAWFGAIIYVHLLLKPAYASKGLPRGELLLGGISMIIVLITGVLLTIARMPALKIFYTTRFGILLSIKIVLFSLMFLSVIIVITFIGPRMRKKKTADAKEKSGAYTPEDLAMFDGRDGRPAYISYKGVIYDVSANRFWKDGQHMRKHVSGQDMTDLLKTAPHGEEKVLALPVVGELSSTIIKPPVPFHEQLFYFFAYMNLAMTFVIVFIIALWRWW